MFIHWPKAENRCNLRGSFYGIIGDMSGEITYWQDSSDGKWLGYWNDYPDYITEGYSFDDLKSMLRDIMSAIREGVLNDTNAGHCHEQLAFA